MISLPTSLMWVFYYLFCLVSYGMHEFEFDPIQRITAEKLRSLGIEAVIHDFDDTLIYTGELFTERRAEYVEIISKETGIDQTVLNNRIQELNDEEFAKMGVAPKRWETVLRRLSEEIKDEGVVMENIDIIMKIYTDTPRLRTGARAILGGLKDSNFKMGLVTHASSEWTIRKLTQTGLLDFFESIVVADENGFKTKEHWKKCMDDLGVNPGKCLVVGDNLKGDIIPAVSLGARAIWMPSPWSVYREGEVPQGVVEMSELQDFWDAVQKLK